MALTPGTRLGPYEIVSALGAGGMGEVYRARDARLDRDVAIKILPEAFAADSERVARFQREAKVLASLNHPNIAIIHGLEQAEGAHALVMELVEGEDLAQRIARGAIPVDEALPIAKQIAEALEAAHEQGIMHRDLKPANIKVRPDGTVKVLDFGLAKAMDPVGSAPNMSQSPTITTPAMTQAGMILGTAAYMSPEQAKADRATSGATCGRLDVSSTRCSRASAPSRATTCPTRSRRFCAESRTGTRCRRSRRRPSASCCGAACRRIAESACPTLPWRASRSRKPWPCPPAAAQRRPSHPRPGRAHSGGARCRPLSRPSSCSRSPPAPCGDSIPRFLPPRRLTFEGQGHNRFPVWSADSQRVAFQSDREGDLGIFWQRADGAGTAERLTKADEGVSQIPESWAAGGDDGERFLYNAGKGGATSLWVFSLKDRKAARFDAVESPARTLTGAVFSPDGRWVAYAEGRASTAVYVQPFPPTGAKYQISKNADAGHHPMWSPDGAELLFALGRLSSPLNAVRITAQPSFTVGEAIRVPRPFQGAAPNVERPYDISRDGQHLLGLIDAAQTQSGAPAALQIQVVLNWFEELKARVPVR